MARWYISFEHVAFGKRLEKHRFAFLDAALTAQKALILGEGDGRFICELARLNRAVEIVCIEASGSMIEIARDRLRRTEVHRPERIRFVHGDARLISLAEYGPYDLVVTHFFLDCFSDEDTRRLVRSIAAVSDPGASWLIAEFQQPESGWRKWHARVWLAAMYAFFRLVTGLKTRSLPNHREILANAGFTLLQRRVTSGRLICSELWLLP